MGWDGRGRGQGSGVDWLLYDNDSRFWASALGLGRLYGFMGCRACSLRGKEGEGEEKEKG